jgi:hypothetical protein
MGDNARYMHTPFNDGTSLHVPCQPAIFFPITIYDAPLVVPSSAWHAFIILLFLTSLTSVITVTILIIQVSKIRFIIDLCIRPVCSPNYHAHPIKASLFYYGTGKC